MRDSVIADWAVAVAYPSKYAYGSPRDSARAGRAEPDRLGTAQAPHPTVGARTRADGTAQAPHPTVGARIRPVGAALVAGPRRSAVQRMGAEDVEGSSGRQDGTAQAPRPTGGVRTCPVGLSLADSRSASSDPGSNPWYRAGSGSSTRGQARTTSPAGDLPHILHHEHRDGTIGSPPVSGWESTHAGYRSGPRIGFPVRSPWRCDPGLASLFISMENFLPSSPSSSCSTPAHFSFLFVRSRADGWMLPDRWKGSSLPRMSPPRRPRRQRTTRPLNARKDASRQHD